MPSTRRIRLVSFIIFATLVIYFTYCSFLEWSKSPDTDIRVSAIAVSDFYTKTLLALDQERSPFEKSSDDSMHNAHTAVAQTNSQSPNLASATFKNHYVHPTDTPPFKPSWVKYGNKNFQKLLSLRSRDAPEVDQELFRILSISPIVIFSKSACTYSQQAKRILLQKYTIYPEPLTVELDLHPSGKSLQESVATLTDRATVPNILIFGQSIGGADEILDMHKKHSLITKINELAKLNLRINAREED